MNYSVTGEQLTGIADAIRAKTGGSAGLEFPDDFSTAIGTLTKTSDANATASDIKSGKTAYVNGTKITGSYTPQVTITENASGSFTFSNGRASYSQGDIIAEKTLPSNEIGDITPGQYSVVPDSLTAKVYSTADDTNRKVYLKASQSIAATTISGTVNYKVQYKATAT